MSLSRIVVTETLDGLSEDDPTAMRSRRDLQRVHRVMGTRSIVRRALTALLASRPCAMPLRILELGAGDGTLMLGVAQALRPRLSDVELTLLDRQDLLESATVERYAKLGWKTHAEVIDVLDWITESSPLKLQENAPKRWDLIVANLFLHHFEGEELAALLYAIAATGDRFFACEPRRSWFALTGSHLIGALGVNTVTRHDAVLSVHAGFCNTELGRLWPAPDGEWQIEEYPAGLFSHCFSANRL